MTGHAVCEALLALAANEWPPTDAAVVARVVMALRQAHPELRSDDSAVDASLRAGALARLDTADLVAELERRGLGAA
jgi:hypothetical protein